MVKESTIIPPIQTLRSKEEISVSTKDKRILYLGVFISFICLITVVTFLPMSQTLKMVSLIIGSFILVDLHRTLKRV